MQRKEKRQSPYCQAFELFLQGRPPVQVAIDLDLYSGRVMSILYGFLRLQNMHKAATIMKEYKDQLTPFVKMFEWLKKNNTRGKDIKYAVDNVNIIKSLRQQKEFLKKEDEYIKGMKDYLLDTWATSKGHVVEIFLLNTSFK